MGSRGGGGRGGGGGRAQTLNRLAGTGFPENGITQQGYLSEAGKAAIGSSVADSLSANQASGGGEVQFKMGEPNYVPGGKGGSFDVRLEMTRGGKEEYRYMRDRVARDDGNTMGGAIADGIKRFGFTLKKVPSPPEYRVTDSRRYSIMSGENRVGRLDIQGREPTAGMSNGSITFAIEGK
jgi:hypothetical protein